MFPENDEPLFPEHDAPFIGTLGIRTLDGVQGLYEITKVRRNGHGDILYFEQADGYIIPWTACMLIHKLDPENSVIGEDEAIVDGGTPNG